MAGIPIERDQGSKCTAYKVSNRISAPVWNGRGRTAIVPWVS